MSILLAFTAAVGLVFGTAGFTTIDADRGVGVNITDDDNGYLGYEPLVNEGEDITAGQSTPVVEYHNQIGVNLDSLDVSVSRTSSSGPTIEASGAPSQLNRGSAGTVSVTLNCSTTQDIELKLEVTGSGSGTSITFDRTLEVTCVPNQEEEEEDGESEK
ncbi:hypothetical protein [Halorubrum ezzemoulense]|uniref:hypothetical protein n=1 Tax=Halorubrum ezzemoulense TaxID=337243 RepID=UPI00117A29F7|nr:hypothetical protein [Halorubrum ezzemoulense]